MRDQLPCIAQKPPPGSARRQFRRLNPALFTAAVFLSIVTGTMPFLPATKAGSDVLSTDTSSCEGPASTPACASKTWIDCLDYRNPSMCAEVGRPDIEFWETEVSDDRKTVIYKKEAPRSEPLGLQRDPILGVAVVSPDRFNWLPDAFGDHYHKFGLYDPSAVAPELRGTHEVKYGSLYEGKVSAFSTYSHFFRKDGDRWVLTSWSWHFNETCDMMDLNYNPHCRYFVYPVPWDKWYGE